MMYFFVLCFAIHKQLILLPDDNRSGNNCQVCYTTCFSGIDIQSGNLPLAWKHCQARKIRIFSRYIDWNNKSYKGKKWKQRTTIIFIRKKHWWFLCIANRRNLKVFISFDSLFHFKNGISREFTVNVEDKQSILLHAISKNSWYNYSCWIKSLFHGFVVGVREIQGFHAHAQNQNKMFVFNLHSTLGWDLVE